MADTQQAPHSATQPTPALEGSILEAQEAILGLLEPEKETPETEEAAPEEVEESTEETQDESSEEVSEEEEEDESEDKSEEESEEEPDEDEEEEEPDIYTVRVDGEDVEVSLDELVKGYSRQSDYTRKTQEIAEQRKQAEAVMQQAQHEVYQTQQFRQQYIDAASAAVQQQYGRLQELDHNTDWDRLKLEDREEYLTLKAEKSDLESSMAQEQRRIEQAQEQAQHEQRQALEQVAIQEREKLEAIIPEWRNPEFRQKVGQDLTEFGLSQGFTELELKQLVDHRSLLILMQAKAFQEMQKAQQSTKAKKTKRKPKMVSSGTGKKKGEDKKSKRTAQMKRLQQTGHVDDSVSLFEDFVDI
jgi:hypothetical protein